MAVRAKYTVEPATAVTPPRGQVTVSGQDPTMTGSPS
jgi:hypothetical protein